MDESVAELVWRRSHNRCEYCLMLQEHDDTPFQVDHIIARKHGGSDEPGNLALACLACNNHIGPNIAGIDPDTGHLTRLFHPRNDKWAMNFVWRGPILEGSTPVGRTTIAVLAINLAYRVELRSALLAEGVSFAAPESNP